MFENTKRIASFPLSEELYKEVESLLNYIKSNISDSKSRQKLAETIILLTQEGLDYFFKQSLELIGVGLILRNTINIGLKTTKNTIKLLSKKFTKKLSDEQLMKAVNFIENFIKLND